MQRVTARLFSKSKQTIPKRRTQEASLQTLTAPPQQSSNASNESQQLPPIKSLPSSASFIAEDLDRAFAGFRRKFHVNDDDNDDDDEEESVVVKPDFNSTLTRRDITVLTLPKNESTRSSRPFEELPSASAAAAAAISVIERAAAAALGFEVSNTSRSISSSKTSQPLMSNNISVSQKSYQGLKTLSQSTSNDGKSSRRKKGEPETVTMSVALQGMAEQLDMQMLCMSRRLATFSGDSELLQPAVATFKTTLGSDEKKKTEILDKEVDIKRASLDSKDEKNIQASTEVPVEQNLITGRPPLPQADTAIKYLNRTDLQDLRRSWEQLAEKQSGETRNTSELQLQTQPTERQSTLSVTDEESTQAAANATAMFMASNTNQATRRNPSAAWFDAVSSALRGDVQGTLAALEERTVAELRDLVALEETQKAESLRKIHEEFNESSVFPRAPRLDLTLQPEGRLSPVFESTLKARWQNSQVPNTPFSSRHVVIKPQQPRIIHPPEKEKGASRDLQLPVSSSSPTPLITLPSTAAEAAAETAAFLASLGPSSSSIPLDIKSEISSQASALGAALESGGPNKGVPLGPKPSAASSFIPLTAFIPPVVRPRAIYGPDGRISLVSGTGDSPDPYQSLAAAAAAEGRPLFPHGPGNESKAALLDFSAIQAQALDGSARFKSSVSASELRNLPTLPTSSDTLSTFTATTRAPIPAPHSIPSYVSPQGDLPPPPISPPLGFFGFAGQPPATQDLYRQLERYFLEELKTPPTSQTAFSGTFQRVWPTISLPPNIPPTSFVSRPSSQTQSTISSPSRSVRYLKQPEVTSASTLSAEVDRLLHEHKVLESRTLESWAKKEDASDLSGTGGIRDRPRLSVPQTQHTSQSIDAQGAVRRAQEALERLNVVKTAIAMEGEFESSGYVDLQGSAW